MLRHQRILDALKRRVLAVTSRPEELLRETQSFTGDPGYSLPTYYHAGISLGLFSESEARPFCLLIARNAERFTTTDITRAFKYIIESTRSLPFAEREEALKHFTYCFQSQEVLSKFRPEDLFFILKDTMSVRSPESFHEEPMLVLKNFLTSFLCTRLSFLQPSEIGELILIMSHLGASCTSLSHEMLSNIINSSTQKDECAGPVAGALARISRYASLPSPATEDFFDFAYQSASSARCGGQHQVTVLRALLVLETDLPARFPPGRAAKLLETIKESGMTNFEGPNLAMMFSILARMNKTDDSLVETLMECILPQLETAKPLTLGSIVKNVAQLGVHMPGRLAEACNRRILHFARVNEPFDSIITCLQGASRCANTTARSRKVLMQCITETVHNKGEDMTMEDFSRLTRTMANGFGVNRSRTEREKEALSSSGSGRVSPLTSELDLETLDFILMRVLSLSAEPKWAVVEVMRNLAELGIDYEEMKPLAKSILVDRQLEISVLTRFVRSLQIANCRDVLLYRAVINNAKRASSEELKKVVNDAIARIEGGA